MKRVCNLGQILGDYLPHQNIVINTKGVDYGKKQE